MTGYILSPKAQHDIDAIWDYTVGEWGEKRAIDYTTKIRDLCGSLAEGRLKGRPANIRAGYRKALTGSHVLYFRMGTDGTIIVIRVLHQRQDVSRHL